MTPLLFVVASAAIVLNTLATQPGRALTGLAIVLAGTPVFYIWRSRLRSAGLPDAAISAPERDTR